MSLINHEELKKQIASGEFTSLSTEFQQYFLKTLIGYLHNIHVPDNIYIDLGNIKQHIHGDSYIRLCKEVFYLPNLLKSINI